MNYPWVAIPDSSIPHAVNPVFQHLIDTYVSESNKVGSTWKQFTDTDLEYKPHIRSSSVGQILRHQLLSERRFFGEFLGTPEPAPDEVLPAAFAIESATNRFVELVVARLGFFARQQESWWMEIVHSSMSNASVSGYSGAACFTPRITAPNSPSSCGCSGATSLRPTAPPPTSAGPVRTLRIPCPQPDDVKLDSLSLRLFFPVGSRYSLRTSRKRCPPILPNRALRPMLLPAFTQ